MILKRLRQVSWPIAGFGMALLLGAALSEGVMATAGPITGSVASAETTFGGCGNTMCCERFTCPSCRGCYADWPGIPEGKYVEFSNFITNCWCSWSTYPSKFCNHEGGSNAYCSTTTTQYDDSLCIWGAEPVSSYCGWYSCREYLGDSICDGETECD